MVVKVRFSKGYSGPLGSFIPGQVITLDDDAAKKVVSYGAAVAVVEGDDGQEVEAALPETSAERKAAFLDTIEDRDELKGILDVAGVEYTDRTATKVLRKRILENPDALANIPDPAAPTPEGDLEDLTDDQLLEKFVLAGGVVAELGENPDREVIIAKLTEGPPETTGTEETGSAGSTDGSGSGSEGSSGPRER